MTAVDIARPRSPALAGTVIRYRALAADCSLLRRLRFQRAEVEDVFPGLLAAEGQGRRLEGLPG